MTDFLEDFASPVGESSHEFG